MRKAEIIAREAHKDQKRKFGSQAPYITHPERVAAKVRTLPGTDEVDEDAAWLHDTVEDIAIPTNRVVFWCRRINDECGPEVLTTVLELTNLSCWHEEQYTCRADKRFIDFAHMRGVGRRAKRLKMVDRWDNLRDIEGHEKNFLKKYIPESFTLLEICRDACPVMAAELAQLLKEIGPCR